MGEGDLTDPHWGRWGMLANLLQEEGCPQWLLLTRSLLSTTALLGAHSSDEARPSSERPQKPLSPLQPLPFPTCLLPHSPALLGQPPLATAACSPHLLATTGSCYGWVRG